VSTEANQPQAELSTGRVRGRSTGGIRRFLGIPYALPPFGERRFRAPEPVQPWEGVRDAVAFGPSSPQTPYPGAIGKVLPSIAIPGDDILTVNVWSPDGAKDAPVVLWLHGGAFERGASALDGYDGTQFAADGVVTVTANYRLGGEGFSVLDGAPLNLGLWDAALALEWVHREIAGFGGDPERITVMGESAGGALVAALLTRGVTRKLMAGAIIQSGPLTASTPAAAGRATKAIAARLRVPATRDAFLAIGPDELLRARTEITAGKTVLSGTPGYALSLDDEMLPVSPHLALRETTVPMLIGTNTDEYRLWFTPEQLAGIGRVKSWVIRSAMRVPGKAADAVRAALPAATPGEVLGQLVTDRIFRGPSSVVAAGRTSPTYVYEFAWQSPVRDLRAAHAVEIAFVFNRIDAPDALPLSGRDAPIELAREMHAAWVEFIRTGAPGWEPYTPGRMTRVFDEHSQTLPQRRASVLDALG
jgi:para-nitrobenzyl esterase